MSDQDDSSRAASGPKDKAGDLDELREAIDSVDREILEKLNDRARLVQKVGALKSQTGDPVYSAARERDLVFDLQRANSGPFPSDALPDVFREVVSGTRSLEKRLKIAYLGPEGTFSQQAVLQQFGSQVDSLECATIADVFKAVEHKRVDHGVVPVENTTQGAVTQTLDYFIQSDVAICGEVRLKITNNLFSQSGRIEDVSRVVSHTQPFAQCREWLEAKLPGVDRIETSSTATAAKLAQEDSASAAIGSELAAEVYGLKIIERSIEDRSDNTTRFLILGSHEIPASGNDATAVMFTTGRDESGTLFRLLDPFARHGVNLTSIQSRPMVGRPWEYMFFVDLQGHRSDPNVAKALEEAAKVAHSCKILGSFPSSTPQPEEARG